jgi:hypothetical protein
MVRFDSQKTNNDWPFYTVIVSSQLSVPPAHFQLNPSDEET